MGLSVCPCYRSFFYGTLHMCARLDEEHNYKEKMFTFQTWKIKSNIIQWLASLLSHGDIWKIREARLTTQGSIRN